MENGDPQTDAWDLQSGIYEGNFIRVIRFLACEIGVPTVSGQKTTLSQCGIGPVSASEAMLLEKAASISANSSP